MDSVSENNGTLYEGVPSEKAWGYGFLFVTIINVCSLVGVLVMPCMKLAIYKQVLLFMVSLAAGTLAGSGMLFLIPEAFHMTRSDDKLYIWKSSTIVGGIYLFFVLERVMNMIGALRERKKSAKKSSEKCIDNIYCSLKSKAEITENDKMKEPPLASQNSSVCTTMVLLTDDDSSDSVEGTSSTDRREKEDKKEKIASVAWMIIFGDGLHNFIDGLSIGAAFTENVLAGVSVSVAVICEELPHELGDFAILLNAGMSLKKALAYNFLSACMCYLGLIVGVLLGENTTAHDWIFAIAGGMFLYISLVDMMPEMSKAGLVVERTGRSPLFIFFIQNLGILTGFAIMLLMALFGDRIDFTS